MKKNISIAIDGPSGSGKSTIAEMLAKKFGILHLNSGSLYRAFALACQGCGIDEKSQEAVVFCLKQQKLSVGFANGKQQTILNGEIVDFLLRDEKIGMTASKISSYLDVREMVNKIIRRAAQEFGIVVEGRDIGSVVLKNADFKFYLDAKAEVRAKRRFDELLGKVPYENILSDILQRDKQDSTRAIAPLTRCEDAIYIDSSYLSANEVCDIMQKEMEKRL